MAKRWYVIQTKTKHEAIVAAALKAQRFTVFNPTYNQPSKQTNKQNRDRILSLPLFPTYIFVQFDHKRNSRWRSIRSTKGVVAMIACTETHITPVPEGYVEELKERLDASGNVPLNESVDTTIQFSPEMKLAVRGERYAGLVGTYCNHSENRVTLLLTLLNRPIKVILPISAVRPA